MQQSFRETLEQFGLRPVEIVADSNIHRCTTEDNQRKRNGWYVLFTDTKGGVYGDFSKGGEHHHWHSEGEAVSPQIITARKEQFRKVKEAAQEQAAQDAVAYFDSLARDGYSDYLKEKQIYPHGARFDGNVLVIPIQDASGKVWSYQKIYGDGNKYFHRGGKISGCYFMIAGRNVSKSERVVVCEGFATGASIHQATSLPVVVAFNAGNLKKVCDSLPFHNLVIAADHDISGVGRKAAEETGYPWVMPEAEGWDFSDVFLAGHNMRNYFFKDGGGVEEIRAHGLVGEIADWITATAIKPQPILSLAAALSFVGMLKGHRVAGTTNLRTNLLVLALAPTGSGKEHPQYCLRELSEACGLSKHFMGEPVSGAGLLNGISRCQRVALLIMDEVGRFIGNNTGKSAGVYQNEIIDYIIKLFSKANTVFQGRVYADEKKNPYIEIDQPHFCCLGSSVKEKLQDACRSSDIIDGFLNRWIVFEVQKRGVENMSRPQFQVPERIVDAVKAYQDGAVQYDMYGKPMPVQVCMEPEAYDQFIEFKAEIERLIDETEYPFNMLYSRSAEHAEKLALTLSSKAVVMDEVFEIIAVEDMQLAIQLVRQSNQHIAALSGMIADNESESEYLRVKHIIAKAGTIRRNHLTKKTQFIRAGDKKRQEIIQALLDDNSVVQISHGKLVSYKYIG